MSIAAVAHRRRRGGSLAGRGEGHQVALLVAPHRAQSENVESW